MEREYQPDDDRRSRHACWAMPGAVSAIVLMIAAFMSQFDEAASVAEGRSGGTALASTMEGGEGPRAVVAAKH